ncbi:cyclin-dependent kinase 4 inhibitor B-like [Amphiura filiformis]|uniref:cyclin-dependent kinase 4 inhibitor B-like n=1 Tax=Amphiura filiformis TaxID=82378 RepID=UPI003B2189E7
MAEQRMHEDDDVAEPVAEPIPSPGGIDELTQAAAKGEVERVRVLLNQGVHPDSVNKYGYTALQTMNSCYPEIAQMLLERGDPNVQDPHVGTTPLHDAIDNGKPDTVRCLLQGGADVEIKDFGNSPVLVGNTPVHLAAKKENAGKKLGHLWTC